MTHVRPTERLWLTEPARGTSIATVTSVRGDRFTVDRGLFAPKSRLYHHPQEPDRGVVWTASGEKRRLEAVFEEHGTLWHRLRDAVPSVGERLQCHLDPDRRAQTSRAHTALHLFLHATRDLPPLAADPEVRGGASVRLVYEARMIEPVRLAAALKQVQAWCDDDRPLRREPVPRDLAGHRFSAQRIRGADPYPGPETVLDGVFIEGVGGLPCDGTHVARTRAVGRVVARHAHGTRDGTYVVGLAVLDRS